MTMHLVRGMTTINTKRKRHITKSKLERWEKERRIYNKDMKRLGMHGHQMTMEEYIDYVHGNYRSKTKPSAIQTPWHQSGNEFRRNTDNIPSASSEKSFAPQPKKNLCNTQENVDLLVLLQCINPIWFQFLQMMMINRVVNRLPKFQQ